ncbi:MAG TPA: hypothetical protein VKB38_13675 [Terracidiphilus sp.]|nr:hypothetical protein [Terracidiphilus sp.]
MSTDSLLGFAGIGAEALLIATLVKRRVYKPFPVFSLYILLSVVADSVMMALSRLYPDRFLRAFVVEMSIDSVVQFGVLIELAWSVLRPIRNSLPRRFIFVIALLILVAGTAVWPIAGKLALHGFTPEWYLLSRLEQTFAILRVIFFLGMVAFSQVLAIGWRDRELQVATGLGLYSLASLGAAVLHTHPSTALLYHHVDQVVALSYVCSLFYWVYSFLQQEAPRQEFSPRMQSLLLSVAGAARANRLAIEETRKSGQR